MSNTSTVKNNLLVVLGAAIMIGAFMGAIQVSSTNQQAGTLKSSIADKAITEASTAKINPGTGGEKLFLMGGWVNNALPPIAAELNDIWTSNNVINWVQIFPNDPTTTTRWSSRNLFNTALFFNNKIWVMGNKTNWQAGSNDVWASSDGFTWTNVLQNALWSPRIMNSSAVFNNKIWILGGYAGSTYLNDVWSSIDGITWKQEINNAPWADRSGHATVVFNGKMWVIGGESYVGSNGTFYNDVWSSVDGVNWTQQIVSAPWAARAQHTVTVFNGKMWLIGGDSITGNMNVYNDVWSSIDGINWTLETSNAAFPVRMGHSTFVFNNQIWVVAGYSGFAPNPGITYNDVWSSPDGINWTQVVLNASWGSRYVQSVVVTPVSFGCSVRANIIPNTAQLNSGTHLKTYEFQVTTCANPVTISEIDFSTSQSSGVKRGNMKLETNGVSISNALPPVYGSAAYYPIFKPSYTIPAYTTQTFSMTEDIAGNIITGSNTSSNLMKITASFGSAAVSWTNTFPLGITTLTH